MGLSREQIEGPLNQGKRGGPSGYIQTLKAGIVRRRRRIWKRLRNQDDDADIHAPQKTKEMTRGWEW